MSVAHGAILGFGNPLLDITAEVPMSFLEKYGLKNDNQILGGDSHRPLYEEMLVAYKASTIAGGATLNSIRCAQWMLGVSGATGFIGCVGKDGYASILKSAAEKAGVTVHFRYDVVYPTGTCACLINDGERSLVANLEAASKYQKKDHFDTPEIQEVVNTASVFYSSGFFLVSSPETVIAVGEYCAKSNKILAINIAATYIPIDYLEPLEKAIFYSDYVMCNEQEAQAYADVKKWGTSDLNAIALQMAALPKASSRPRTVIFTQGVKDTIVAVEGTCRSFPIRKVEKIVDTNGAGDSFVGGFLSQLVLGKPIELCVDAGHYAGAICVQNVGATYPPTCEYKA